MGNPEDLMGAVTFLSSDASGYVTGADLRGECIPEKESKPSHSNKLYSGWRLYHNVEDVPASLGLLSRTGIDIEL